MFLSNDNDINSNKIIMTHNIAKYTILETITASEKIYNDEPNVKVEDEDNIHRIFYSDLLFVIENSKLHVRKEVNSTYIVLATFFLQNLEDEALLTSIIFSFLDYTPHA